MHNSQFDLSTNCRLLTIYCLQDQNYRKENFFLNFPSLNLLWEFFLFFQIRNFFLKILDFFNFQGIDTLYAHYYESEMRRSKRGEDENAGKKDGPKVRTQKTLCDCISVIMWARRPGCGFLINFANFSINARRSFREKGRWKKGGGSDATTTMASRKEGLPALQSLSIAVYVSVFAFAFAFVFERIRTRRFSISRATLTVRAYASHAIINVDTPNGAWYPKYAVRWRTRCLT